MSTSYAYGFALVFTIPFLTLAIGIGLLKWGWALAVAAVPVVLVTFECFRQPPRINIRRAHAITVLVYMAVLQATVLLGLSRWRELSRRCMDQVSIRSIGRYLMLYHDEYHAYPDDLRQLVDIGYSGQHLLSANSDSEAPSYEQHPYAGPCDYTYAKLPPHSPRDLARVWLSPDFHYKEVGYVLLSEGTVASMPPADMDALIHKTRAWLDSQAQLQAQSQPALN